MSDDSPEILTLECINGWTERCREGVERRRQSLIKLEILCRETETFNRAFTTPSLPNNVVFKAP